MIYCNIHVQRDDELPQNLQKGQESISKSAMKNKKKREAKARAKDEEHTTADHEQVKDLWMWKHIELSV